MMYGEKLSWIKIFPTLDGFFSEMCTLREDFLGAHLET